jgi:hypothetical protein
MNEYRKIAVKVFSAVVFININSSSLDIATRPVDNPPLRKSDKKLLGGLPGWSHYMKNTHLASFNARKRCFPKQKS